MQARPQTPSSYLVVSLPVSNQKPGFALVSALVYLIILVFALVFTLEEQLAKKHFPGTVLDRARVALVFALVSTQGISGAFG